MKLIKKIAAIMFAFMMVVSMSCNVKAVEGTTPTTGETGTITINNAIDGQTYTIYKLLDLESYVPETATQTGLYSYKPAAEWKSFFETAEAKKYITVDKNGYANWVKGANQAEFAQEALDYATANNISNKGTKPASNNTVKFEHLDLGYYLVDSSVGSLCVLNTTNPDLTIAEKNGVPSVEKGVSNTQNGTYGTSNNASIGDTVYFKTTITAQPGAQNYVLHDKMTEGLTFDQNSVNVSLHKNATNNDKNLTNEDYSVVTTGLESKDPKCTFHINFTKELCDRLAANDTITVTYSAVLNKKAEIGNVDKNMNETWLKYGENNNLETTHPTTYTKTFEMNVFKFYEDKNNSNTEKGLAGATFKLTKDSKNANNITFVKTSNETATNDVYRVAKTGETVTTITSPKSGKFTIQGLGAGTYFLTETKQPDGYNKLAKPVKVEIKDNGEIFVDDSKTANIGDVKVENKTGKVLPSTGGAGTTMIYLIGAVLVLGSGVVLATKRRVKGK